MLFHMLVPLDGSPRAERALDLAALLARQNPAQEPALEPLLILFQAIDLAPWLDLDDNQEARARGTKTATGYLEEQAQRLRRQGITVKTVVRVGHPVESILECAETQQAELIIMSTHGRSGLARWALGSVAERVARSSVVPMVLLPDAAPDATIGLGSQAAKGAPQILVPLDGSARAEAALAPALEMARLLRGELRLLYVFVPKFEERSLEETQRHWDSDRRRVHQIERYLMRQASSIQHAGVKAHWSLAYGMPGAKIIDTTTSYPVYMVAMTTQGRGGRAHGRLGNVTEEVLHAGRLPVLLVPSAGVEIPTFAEEAEEQKLPKEALR